MNQTAQSRRRPDYFWLLVLIPILVVAYFSYLWRDYQLDDALIYLRYIKNFQHGLGLVYNPGEKFNGLTSPLFTYAVMASSFLTNNLQLATVAISALCMALAAIVAGKIFSSSRWEAVFTSVAIGSFKYFYTTFGMETPLFLLLIAMSLYLYRIESRYFVIALALLVITRSEGVFLAIPMAVDYVVRHRRLPRIGPLAAAIVIFLIPFAFNYLYYGSFLPATGDAKIGQGRSGFWGQGWIFFDCGFLIKYTFAANKFAAVGGGLFAAYGLFSLARNRVAVVAFAFFVLLLAFYGGLNIPNYHWYYAPFMFLAVIWACRGIWRLSSLLLRHGWLDDRGFLFFLVAAFVVFVFTKVNPHEAWQRQEDYVKVGEWLKRNTPANTSVGLVEIGTVGWYSDRYIIDILGLVNKHNAALIGNKDLYGWLAYYQPDYILRRDPRTIHEASTEMLEKEGAYVPADGFTLPGYVLLKKSGKFTDQQIADMPAKRLADRSTLDALFKSSKVGPPLVKLDDHELFAHAPSTLSLTLPKQSKTISLVYGLNQGAEGRQHGVCFEVIRAKTQEKIFDKCIDEDATANDLVRKDAVDFAGDAGETLIFKTVCKTTCDVAWSYWGQVRID
ncbi:MAG: hypothetical protein JO142_14535 [Burkholderiales bacterium]|nr:hypothetical protein [Burkholderiales bacterium]